ncbi:carbohydrate sulfotransferase 9 [Aplysia californica]|uniref:Carbohydrate sulfotransferase n=1 Tax=Aplysia californica TaxID=6500 RepID=A0ABM1VRF7_APLCA|nr:carbohydrate sulfotransferase 9 [Aplysia californica]
MARSDRKFDFLQTVEGLTKRIFTRRGLVVCALVSFLLVWASYNTVTDQDLKIKRKHGLQQEGNIIHTDTDPRPGDELVERDLQHRKETYEEGCRNGRPSEVVGDLFIFPPNNITVCHVPKAGCTFWKRVFRFLYKDFGTKKVDTLFDLDRLFVHFGKETTFKSYSWRTEKGRSLAKSSFRVMFSRDPYKRLWSSYVDKFMLPDSWIDHGKSMLFSRRKPDQGPCPYDITFEEFLRYVLRNRDPHWRPVSSVCDPCTFRPHVVGHVETFSRDSHYSLRVVGLGHLVEGKLHHKSHVEDELRIMIDYHYGLYSQRLFNQDCLTTVQLAKILWRAFQVNGYFRTNNSFPEDEPGLALTGSVEAHLS